MECVNDEGMNLESWVAIDDDIGDMIPIKKLGRLVRTKLST
jgi:hypothetical protein